MEIKKYLAELLHQYKSYLMEKEKLSLTSNPEPPRLGEIRRLEIFPPIYLLLIEEIMFYQESIFKCVVLTEELELGYLGETPLIPVENIKTLLVVLPLWVYLLEEFLQKYSTKVGYIDEEKREKIYSYALTRKIPVDTPQGHYIELVARRLAPYNTESLLAFFETLEREEPQFIELEERHFEPYEEYRYALAATPKYVLKGPNWFGIVEKLENKARLILYLPQSYIGSKIKIKLGKQTLFEGELEGDKLVLENLPLFSDYSFLEEELDVQV